MVVAHVIGDRAATGMRVADHSFLRYLFFSFLYIRLPLFTAISGYVYALNPIRAFSSGKFLKGKARRILLPLASVSSLQFLMLIIIPGTNLGGHMGDWWKIYIFPFAHFWFLHAIFLVFITITLLEQIPAFKTKWGWTASFSMSVVLFFYCPRFTSFFAFDRYLYLLPFFLLGIGLFRYKKIFSNKYIFYPNLLMLIFGILLQQLFWFGFVQINVSRSSWLSLLIGITSLIWVFKQKNNISWLANLGSYAYGIYLFHVLAAAGCRILLWKVGFSWEIAIFFIGLSAGLAGPVLFEKFLLKTRLTRLIILGLKN